MGQKILIEAERLFFRGLRFIFKNKKAFLAGTVILLVIIVAVVAFFLVPSRLTEEQTVLSRQMTTKPMDGTDTLAINLYFPNFSKAGAGADTCGKQVLFPLERGVSFQSNYIDNTVKFLLRGRLTYPETNDGYSSDFPHAGFSLVGSELNKQGTLTLRFSEVEGFSVRGDSCQMKRVAESIRLTVMQYPDVKKVIFEPKGMFGL
jgi:spore germination protein GerM